MKSSDESRIRKRFDRQVYYRWFVVTVIVLVALISIWSTRELRKRAEEYQDIQTLLVGLDGKGHELDALEWESIAKREVTTRATDHFKKFRSELDDILTRLARLNFQTQEFGEILGHFEKYQRAAAEEFELLAAGKIAESQALDEKIVDPAFIALSAEIDRVNVECGDLARRWQSMASLGSTLTILFAIGVVGLLFWRFSHMRLAFRLAQTRQGFLREKNEALVSEINERKRMEAELQRLSREEEMILNSAGEGIIGLDIHGNHRFVNPAAIKMLGYEAGELIGRHSHEIWHHTKSDGGSYPVEECAIYAALKDGAVHRKYDELFWRKDGTSFPVEFMSTPIREAGKVIGAVVTFSDITVYKQAAEALRRRDKILEAVSLAAERLLRITDWHEAIGDVLVRLGEATGVSRVVVFENTSGAGGEILISQIFEWAVPGMKLRTGDPTLKNIPIHAGGFGRWAEILGRGEVLQGNVREFPAGEERALSAHGIRSIVVVPIMVAGRWWGFLAFDECTSERFWQPDEVEVLQVAANILGEAIQRRLIETDLRESEERFRVMADSAPIMIWLAGEDKRCTYLNRAWLEFTGRTLEQEMGLGWAEDVHPEDRACCLKTYETSFDARKAFSMEYRMRRHDGEFRWMIDSGVPRFTPAGKFSGFIGSCLDITDRKKSEDLLRASEERYRLLFNSGYDALLVHEAAPAGGMPGKFIEVNDVACQRLGYTREEFLEMTPLDIDAPEALSALPSNIAKVQRQQHAIWEGVHVAKDGRKIPVEIANYVFELKGKAMALSAVRDVTEKKLADLRSRTFARLGLQLSEARDAQAAAKAIVNAALELWNWDACFLIQYDNSTQTITELANFDMIDGQRIHAPLTLPGGKATPLIREVLEKGPKLILRQCPEDAAHTTVRFGDTSRVSLSLMFAPICSEQKNIGIVSVQSYRREAFTESDLASLQALADHCAGAMARLQMEAALRESEAKFRTLMENIPQKIFVKDLNFRFVFINGNFARDLDILPDDAVGKDDYDFFPRNLADRYRADDKRVLKTGRTEELEEQYHRGGKEFWVHTTKAPVRDENGAIVGLCGVFQDITGRKIADVTREVSLSLATKLSGARNSIEAARIIFDVADKFWKWDCGTLDICLPGADEVQSVLNVDVVDGERREVPLSQTSSKPTPRIRRIMSQGPELILRTPPYALMSDSVTFGDTTRLSASIMCVPLHSHGESVGVLSIQSYTPNAFSEEDMQTLQALADHCGGALKRIQAETALRESEERFRNLLQNIPSVAIQGYASDGTTRYWNHASERLYGYTAEEAIGRNLLDLIIPPEMENDVRQAIQSMAGTGQPIPAAELSLMRKDGSRVEVFSSHALVQKVGGPLELFCIDIDLTERRRAEEQLHKLSRAIEQSPVSIVITDVAGSIEYVNPKFTRVTGYSLAEAVGKNPRILKSGETSLVEYSRLWQTITAGAEWRGEFHNRKKSGELFWEMASISPIFNSAGKLTHFLAVKEDITERKHLEAEFRQAQKMEAVGQLAGGVAHDFNNLLTVIQGNAELLLMKENHQDERTNDGLKQITAASRRAANLTRQLLAFGRKQVMQAQPLNLNNVVANLTKMLNRIIGEDIELNYDYAPRLPFVHADAGMIEQVLVNLIVNARDAIPHGGQVLVATEKCSFDDREARINSESRAGNFSCLKVSDTGTGIAPEHLPRIFEPFFTTKEVGKGTGLGLATVYGIVKQHKGWIDVSSETGKGTTFKIFLPAIEFIAETETQEIETNLRGGTESILLLEDDPAVREVTKLTLERFGYHVWEAASAKEAHALWQDIAGKINLLLTDIVLPGGVTGLEFAGKLRTEWPTLKVIFTSGYSADVAGKDASFLRRTKSHFLQKPCSTRVLVETVRQCLDEK